MPTKAQDAPDAPTDLERVTSFYATLMDASLTPRQSDAARRIGVRGQTLRNGTRGLGVYVSRGGTFDAATRARVYALPFVIAAVARTLGVDVDTVRTVFAPDDANADANA